MLTQEQIQTILHGIAIPPQPQVMVDLQMEQLNPNFSIDHICKLISQDVGLSGSILKTVNSPYFNLSNKITSINEAVNLLGVNSVINLVNALSIRGALSDNDIISLGRFWDNAMEIAMAAALIAKKIGFPYADEAYTLGLFHNAGIPLLMSRIPTYASIQQQAYDCGEKRITQIENELINTNHAVVGYYVAKSWNLPSYLCEAIHEHHNAFEAFRNDHTDTRKLTLLAILKMAEHICRSYKILGHQDTDYEWQQSSDTILLYTGLSEYDFVSMEEELNSLGLGNTDYYS